MLVVVAVERGAGERVSMEKGEEECGEGKAVDVPDAVGRMDGRQEGGKDLPILLPCC